MTFLGRPVFAVRTCPAPDRFLVGLATLTLFAEVADARASATTFSPGVRSLPSTGSPTAMRRPGPETHRQTRESTGGRMRIQRRRVIVGM